MNKLLIRWCEPVALSGGLKPAGKLCVLLLATIAVAAAQPAASVEGTLSEQGKPVPGALVVLQRLKDADCVKYFSSRQPSEKAINTQRTISTVNWSNESLCRMRK